MESQNDRYSIKNLLFTKAIPNYVIPVPSTGFKVFPCLDCGDKFMFESSLQHHVNRKSIKISYHCRLCNKHNVFYNRCNLLSHIRSHTFKTATINVTDLKIEPLPREFLKMEFTNPKKNDAIAKSHKKNIVGSSFSMIICAECNASIPGPVPISKAGGLPKIRAKHYMTGPNKSLACPICMFKLPTKCAYKAHLRFHFKSPPYVCPECGLLFAKNTPTQALVMHGCEGFQMMRAAARVKCPMSDCHLLDLSDFENHLKSAHLKAVFKCSDCYFASTETEISLRHLRHQHAGSDPPAHILNYYQCQLCFGQLILHEALNDHLEDHKCYTFMFPCWICGVVFDGILELFTHHFNEHDTTKEVKECFNELIPFPNKTNPNKKKQKLYRVVKKCDLCLRSFSYTCSFENIQNLSNECPYKCSAITGPSDRTEQQITCQMCSIKMSQDWEVIKKHYSEYHKSYRCLDIQISVGRINIDKYLKNSKANTLNNPIKKRITRRKRIKQVQLEIEPTTQVNKPQEKFTCKKCSVECESKEILEKHLLVHKDLYMAYQCMECGQSFVVKPTFSKHLLLEHNITNVDEYITEKACFNEESLQKYQCQPLVNEPLKENQCKICRLQLESAEDLEKHFRVHGMAFLMKNNCSKNANP